MLATIRWREYSPVEGIALSLIAWVFGFAGLFARLKARNNSSYVINSDSMSCIVMNLSGYLGFGHLQCATIQGQA